MNPAFDRVAIIGVGLIGGSLGMALCARGLAKEVIGAGPSAADLRLACELGAIHQFTSSIVESVAGAEMVIISTPVNATIPVLQEIYPYLSRDTVVTDVGSTKAAIVRDAAKLLPPGTGFVGGHPMAGTEQAGVRAADPYLFENALYILTPTLETPPAAVDKVSQLAAGVGAKVIKMAPAQHDQAVAAVSHLPHLVAASLVNTVTQMDGSENILPLAAGGFRDATRVAASNPVMWRDILLANRAQVLDMLRRFRAEINSYEEVLAAGEGAMIQEKLASARQVRAGLPAKTSRYLSILYEIVVTVPDRPGAIAAFTAPLAGAGINIVDLEIMRVREGEGGTIRVGFATREEQAGAFRVLRDKGYPVRIR